MCSLSISSQLGDKTLQGDVPMGAVYPIAISLVLQALIFGRSGPTHLWPPFLKFPCRGAAPVPTLSGCCAPPAACGCYVLFSTCARSHGTSFSNLNWLPL